MRNERCIWMEKFRKAQAEILQLYWSVWSMENDNGDDTIYCKER